MATKSFLLRWLLSSSPQIAQRHPYPKSRVKRTNEFQGLRAQSSTFLTSLSCSGISGIFTRFMICLAGCFLIFNDPLTMYDDRDVFSSLFPFHFMIIWNCRICVIASAALPPMQLIMCYGWDSFLALHVFLCSHLRYLLHDSVILYCPFSLFGRPHVGNLE